MVQLTTLNMLSGVLLGVLLRNLFLDLLRDFLWDFLLVPFRLPGKTRNLILSSSSIVAS